MAKKIKKELNADVKMVHGRYGEFKVLIDNNVIIDGGAKVILGLMPSAKDIVEAIRRKAATGETGG